MMCVVLLPNRPWGAEPITQEVDLRRTRRSGLRVIAAVVRILRQRRRAVSMCGQTPWRLNGWPLVPAAVDWALAFAIVCGLGLVAGYAARRHLAHYEDVNKS
jgi:hypothetical protein